MPTVNRNPIDDLSREMMREIKKLTNKDPQKDQFSPEEIKDIKDHFFPKDRPSKIGKKILEIYKDIWFI